MKQVEHQCGLLVERAPRRWGFPHLTFEEFYAGRALAFGSVLGRAGQIRGHLHDPRYDEPILLALGLVARDYYEEIEDLFAAALLGRGTDLEPSFLEDLQGRDFRFALRALADDIPASPEVVDELLSQALDEVLHASGRARFPIYRAALLERVGALKAVAVGGRLVELLAQRVDTPVDDPLAQARFAELAACCIRHPVLTERLIAILGASMDASAAALAAEALAVHGDLPNWATERLIDLIAASAGASVAPGKLGHVIAGQGELSLRASERLVEIIASAEWRGATAAKTALVGQRRLPRALTDRLAGVIARLDLMVGNDAADVLANQTELSATTADRLAEVIAMNTAVDPERAGELLAVSDMPTLGRSLTRGQAPRALAGQRKLPASTNRRLTELIEPANAVAASTAMDALSGQTELPPDTTERLAQFVASTGDPGAARQAARLLAKQVTLNAPTLERLTELLGDSNPDSVALALEALAGQSELSAGATASLAELVASSDSPAAVSGAAQLLTGGPTLYPGAAVRIAQLIAGTENLAAATDAAQLLADQGKLPAVVKDRLVALIESTHEPPAAIRAARLIATSEKLPATTIERLVDFMVNGDTGADTQSKFACQELLSSQGELPAAATHRLIDILLASGREAPIDRFLAGFALAGHKKLPPDTIERLIEAISAGHTQTAGVLTGQTELSADMTERLVELARQGNDEAYRAVWRS
ncbi:MAG: NACHT domain-containing protein [Solirubrobacteraceae bacterium]